MAHPAALARFQARVAAAQGRGPARSKPCDSSTLCQLQPDWHPASLVAVGRSSSGADADDPAHRYKLVDAASAANRTRLARLPTHPMPPLLSLSLSLPV